MAAGLGVGGSVEVAEDDAVGVDDLDGVVVEEDVHGLSFPASTDVYQAAANADASGCEDVPVDVS